MGLNYVATLFHDFTACSLDHDLSDHFEALLAQGVTLRVIIEVPIGFQGRHSAQLCLVRFPIRD